ncbi:MAG: YegP family protein [Bacteroidota bacterium]
MANAKFEITKGKNGEFYFNLKAKNGQVILTSEGYSSKAGCKNGLESVAKNSKDKSNFEKKEAKNGKLYFSLLAANKQIIGSSQMYKSTSGRDNGIKSVQENAGGAEVVDLTAE